MLKADFPAILHNVLGHTESPYQVAVSRCAN